MMLREKILGCLALAALPAIAYAATADIIKARQANLKKMAGAFKGLNDELRKSDPSVAVLRTNASNLSAASSAAMKGFPKGSGSAAGVKTTALPVIWSKPAEFKAAQTKHQNAVAALKTAAAGSDVAKIRAAVAGLGPTCKGCHDQFKAKD